MTNVVIEAVKELIWPHREQNAVPSLDGPWAQDDRLDALPTVLGGLEDARSAAVDAEGRMLVASGRSLLRFSGEGWRERETLAAFEADAHGVFADAGSLAVCLAGAGVRFLDGPWKGRTVEVADGRPLASPTAMAALSPSRFVIADASERPNGEFRRDYLEEAKSGRIIVADMEAGSAETLADGLDYPTSLAHDPRSRALLVTEAWGCRVSSLDLSSPRPAPVPRLKNLPGFPWRLLATGDGYLLSFLSLRTQLLEFVRSERKFRARMMDAMAPEFWIAPAVRTTDHLYEPVQGGQIRHHGVTKPWAPPRSYGLLARLGPGLEIRETWHSRHGGRRHGLTGLAGAGAGFLVLSQGAGEVFEVRPHG